MWPNHAAIVGKAIIPVVESLAKVKGSEIKGCLCVEAQGSTTSIKWQVLDDQLMLRVIVDNGLSEEYPINLIASDAVNQASEAIGKAFGDLRVKVPPHAESRSPAPGA